MQVYKIETPDGSSYKVEAENEQQANDAIQSYIPNQSSEGQDEGFDIRGKLSAFMRAAGNQMPLGNQFAALASKGGYSKNLEAIKAESEKLKEENPVAYGAGAVTGAVAPTLVPGVGPMMAANPAAAGALIGGTGAFGDTDLQKHPVLGTAQAVGGAAGGAVLSKVLSTMMPPAQKALESQANAMANKSVNLPQGVLGKMTEAERQAQGAALRGAGVIVKDKQVALNNADKLLKDYGQKIGSIAQTAEGQGLRADPQEHYSFMTNLLEEAKKFEGSANKLSKAIGRDYKAGATDLASLGDNPSWSAIQALKEKYGTFAFKDNATQGAKDTYFALSNMLKNIADRAQGSTSLGQEYKGALAGYSQMAPVVDGLRDYLDAELRGGKGSHSLIGMIKKMPTSVRAAIGTIGAVTGHPHYALAAALPEITNPALQSQAIGGISKAIPALQNVGVAGGASAITSPEVQGRIANLIRQLKEKYDRRRKM